MWCKCVFAVLVLVSLTRTMQIKNIGFENRTVSACDFNNTNDSLVNKIKHIIKTSINNSSDNKNNKKYDNSYFSLTVNITSKFKVYTSRLDVVRSRDENKTGYFDKLLTTGNQPVTESIDNVRIRMTNYRGINMGDDITARLQHASDNGINNNTIDAGAVVYDMSSQSKSWMDIKATVIPAATRPSRDGSLSETQHETIVEIIKAVKCALNVIALFMTLMSVIAFSRTKHLNSSTTFIMALNIFAFIAALLSLVGYSMSFSLGTTSEIYLFYTQYMNMYTGAVCRRIVYLLNMLMSGQRFAVITLPFLARRKFTNSINVVIIVVVVIVTFGTHAYVPVCYKVEHRGGEVFSLGYSPLYKRHADSFETASSATKFLFAFLPLVASLLVNILLLAYLKHHARTTKNLRVTPTTDEAFSRQNRQVTLIVLVSSVSFTLFSFPANIHLLTTSYTTEYGYNQKEHYLFMVIHESLLGLLTLGDIANFLSYIILSAAFRSQIRSAFKTTPLLRSHRPALTSSQATSVSSSCSILTITRHSQ